MNYLTQISRISQRPHCLARGCRHAECFHPEAHTSDSDVCFCEIREICVRNYKSWFETEFRSYSYKRTARHGLQAHSDIHRRHS